MEGDWGRSSCGPCLNIHINAVVEACRVVQECKGVHSTWSFSQRHVAIPLPAVFHPPSSTSIAASSDGGGGVPRPAGLQGRAHLLGCPGGARQAIPCDAGERPLSGRLRQTAVTCNSTLLLTAWQA